jgi:hypothetical protein
MCHDRCENARVGDEIGQPWHQALAYAVTGRLLPDLGLQERADVDALAAELRQRAADGELQLLDNASAASVPADLRTRLGAAQFAAALAGLRTALDLNRTPRTAPGSGRPLTADERRLQAEVPPHHGT